MNSGISKTSEWHELLYFWIIQDMETFKMHSLPIAVIEKKKLKNIILKKMDWSQKFRGWVFPSPFKFYEISMSEWGKIINSHFNLISDIQSETNTNCNI